jgi:hypothetical protein
VLKNKCSILDKTKLLVRSGKELDQTKRTQQTMIFLIICSKLKNRNRFLYFLAFESEQDLIWLTFLNGRSEKVVVGALSPFDPGLSESLPLFSNSVHRELRSTDLKALLFHRVVRS